LSSLHTPLDTFHFAFEILPFEQCRVEFAETPVELKAEELRIPSAEGILGEIRSGSIDVAYRVRKISLTLRVMEAALAFRNSNLMAASTPPEVWYSPESCR